MRRDDLNWLSIAERGDAGAGMPHFAVSDAPAGRKWRPSLFTILVFTAYALWELSGFIRAANILPSLIHALSAFKHWVLG